MPRNLTPLSRKTLLAITFTTWAIMAGAVDRPVFTPPVPAPAPNLAPGGAAAPVAAQVGGDSMDCLLDPSLVTHLGSPVEGTLSEVLVDRGSEVRKGQVVARLNSGVESATVKLRQAQEEYGKRKVARNVELFNQELISASEKDELETQTRLAGLELKQQQEVLGLKTIVSPINGVVVERYMAPGDRVAQDKILKIAQINPLNVEVVVPVNLFGKVRPGMQGKVLLAPLLSGNYSAKVVVVDRVVDAASGTFRVRLQLPNPGNKIPSGIRCSVRFNS